MYVSYIKTISTVFYPICTLIDFLADYLLGGLFEFHVFVPNSYPDAAPLVNLETTGGNQVMMMVMVMVMVMLIMMLLLLLLLRYWGFGNFKFSLTN